MKDLFCAKCQKVTPHKGSINSLNGEFIFDCQNQIEQEDGSMVACDRFIKFPPDITKDQFNELASKHQEVNVGQVTLEKQEEVLAHILDESTPSQTNEDPVPSSEAEESANKEEVLDEQAPEDPAA